MNSDNNIREQGYQYFLAEAPELLRSIEQELLHLREDYSLVKVHSLMRITHTLKGASANVGLDTIKTIAHHLEDVFKALYNPEIEIDPELEMLLYEGYECLRLPLMAEITGSYVNYSEALDRSVAVFAKLQEKLGDYFGREAQIPTSVELGFDITKSIFEVGVKQRLESLEEVINTADSSDVEAALREQAEIFMGLAESLNLPGFGAIVQNILTALEIHRDQVNTIAKVALSDLWQAWSAVIAGDRTSGGQPSLILQQLAATFLPTSELEKSRENLSNDSELSDIYPNESDNIFAPEILTEETKREPELITEQFLDSELSDVIVADEVISETSAELSLDEVFGNFTEPENEVIFARKILEITADFSEVTEAENEVDSEVPIATSTKENSPVETAANLNRKNLQNPDVLTRKTTLTPNFETAEPTPTKLKIKTPPSSPQTTANVKVNHSSVRVDLELLERLSHLTGELLIGQNRESNISEQLQESIGQLWYRLRRHQQTISNLRDWSDQMLIAQERQRVIEMKNLASGFDSLELDQYSELHELLQTTLEELVQLEEAIESTDYLTRQSNHILEKQRRLLTNVQDDMRTARMLPLGEIFSRFPRLLQQLSAAHNKPIKLTLTGTEVLVDRALAEKLYDPLLHLIRNAFDHGIEQPENRASKGKLETGHIEICAYHRGNHTVIEVRDDGQGLDLDRIRKRAVELQFLSAEQAKNASETALFDLLFEPGFSTASQVSELSGRGIGLNVVRSQMEALTGNVIVYSKYQQGTTFLLQFPLTLTMAKLMICEVKGTVYALLFDAIEQILIPKSDQIQYNNGQKVLHLKKGGGVIPISNMDELMAGKLPIYDQGWQKENFKSTQQSETFKLSSTPLLLIRQISQVDAWQGSEIVGLEVDQIMGEQELVIRSLGKIIAPPNYVYGGSTLADGRLTLVIDPTALINQLFNQIAGKQRIPDMKWQMGEAQIEPEIFRLNPHSQPSLPRLPAARLSLPSAPKKILVVDDSISVRQTLAMNLQRAGYQVIQAQNGREALHQMEQNENIILVFCDIEMPSMNGFEFLSHCRQDAVLAKIPVVMLTSRTSEKHRLLAKELGAVGYFTKPYREQEILTLIDDLIKQKAPTLA